MAEPAKKMATYQDLCNIPENMVAEIVDGVLVATPRPARRHVEVASTLGGEIIPPYRFGRGGGPGGWIIYFEPELHFGPKNILVPDLAGWRRERLSTPPGEHRFAIPPDWVCEILSPGTASRDRIVKMRIYAAHGVAYAWIIDPYAKTLEVFKLESERWVLLDGYMSDDKVRAQPFEKVELDLANFWLEEPSEPETTSDPDTCSEPPT
jgi:Uma2 family endonuclease